MEILIRYTTIRIVFLLRNFNNISICSVVLGHFFVIVNMLVTIYTMVSVFACKLICGDICDSSELIERAMLFSFMN